MIRTQRFSAAVLGLLLAAAACNNDKLNRPFANIPVDLLFDRYVSMGNSITAGWQSGGINDSTQQRSYAVLLAHAMRSPFFVPSLTNPGCPPPITNIFTQARLTPTGFPPSTATSCYLRRIPSEPPPYISNTAVPGAEVLDLAVEPVEPVRHRRTAHTGGGSLRHREEELEVLKMLLKILAHQTFSFRFNFFKILPAGSFNSRRSW